MVVVYVVGVTGAGAGAAGGGAGRGETGGVDGGVEVGLNEIDGVGDIGCVSWLMSGGCGGAKAARCACRCSSRRSLTANLSRAFETLVDSMSTRCFLVVKAKGNTCRF